MRAIINLGLLLTFAPLTQGAIVELELTENEPVQILVHPDATSTILFPEVCKNGAGVGFVEEEVLSNALSSSKEELTFDYDYVFYFQDSRTLTMYPAKRESLPYRNFNVWCGDSVYVIEPVLAANGAEAFTKVTLSYPKPEDESGDKQGSRELDSEKRESKISISRTSRPLSSKHNMLLDAQQIVGFLQLTQLASTLDQAALEDLKESKMIPNSSDPYALFDYAFKDSEPVHYQDFSLQLFLVTRNNKADATGFFGLLNNETDREIRVDRNSFFVRVGKQLHTSKVTDFPSVIEPGQSVPFWFVVYRTDGHRTNLSVSNQFEVGVKQIK